MLEDLESEVSGDFLKTLEALLKPTIEYEAEWLKKAMKVKLIWAETSLGKIPYLFWI